MTYQDTCSEMRRKGWLSHPLACVNTTYGKVAKLPVALRATLTYQAYERGETAPVFDPAKATAAWVTFRDQKGEHRDQILVNREDGLVQHTHSGTGNKTVAFLGDFPRDSITSG